jgi:hypothetical protein
LLTTSRCFGFPSFPANNVSELCAEHKFLRRVDLKEDTSLGFLRAEIETLERTERGRSEEEEEEGEEQIGDEMQLPCKGLTSIRAIRVRV